MIESLRQYRARTSFMGEGLPEGALQTNARLPDKIGAGGEFLPFCGDTVIFDLPEHAAAWLKDVQDQLYAACGACLAKRLPPESFHLTLHDLLNAPGRMPDGMEQNRSRAHEIIAGARKEFTRKIALRAAGCFSMVGTSIVMGFEPADEESCELLMRLYKRFQDVVFLPYPLTLHVTLAYFRPGAYDAHMLAPLRGVICETAREGRILELSLEDLHYARFGSMECYQTDPG